MGKPKNRACPDCGETVPYSYLICECGGSINTGRSSSDGKSSGTGDQTRRRRTERVKREKPNFYDALEYQKPAKLEKRGRKKGFKPSEKPAPAKKEPSPPPSPPFVSQRMQLTVKRVAEEEVKEEELEEIILSEEKILKFSQILDEINRKICASSWKGLL